MAKYTLKPLHIVIVVAVVAVATYLVVEVVGVQNLLHDMMLGDHAMPM